MKILFIGDIHGRQNYVKCVKYVAYNYDVDAVVFVGDTLYDQEQMFMQGIFSIKNAAKDLIPTFVVAGNHENFDLIYQQGLGLYGSSPVSAWGQSHVFWLPRGAFFEFDGLTFCAVGGGTSIDRHFRVLGKSFWAQETISEVDLFDVIKDKKANVLVSHDSPNHPALNSFLQLSESQVREQFGAGILHEAAGHRILLDRVAASLEPSLVVHGHYHENVCSSNVSMPWGECSYVGLSNIDATFFSRGTVKKISRIGKVAPPSSGSWWILDTERFSSK